MSKKTIAIVGSGPAALLAAHALQKSGHYQTTVFSDVTPTALLSTARPTGTPVRFDDSLTFERELGLDRWSDVAPKIEGVHLSVAVSPTNRLLTMVARLPRPAAAVDLRLQCAKWLEELAARGGKVEIETVSVDRLDEIAGSHDVTVVATGRRVLADLFERDKARSKMEEPPRYIGVVIMKASAATLAETVHRIKFNVIGDHGEIFLVPFLDSSGQRATAVCIEAVPGSPLDCFRDVKSGEELLKVLTGLVRQHASWHAPVVADPVLSDANAWLTGQIKPSVRKPFARLPSGRVVAALGDTVMSMDPVAAQGANNGYRMAKKFVAALLKRDEPIDEAWITSTFEDFYLQHGERAFAFTDLLARPMGDAGKALLIAQYGSTGQGDGPEQKIADAIARNFSDPTTATSAFETLNGANALIATHVQSFGHGVRKRAAIAMQQVRRLVGQSQRHP